MAVPKRKTSRHRDFPSARSVTSQSFHTEFALTVTITTAGMLWNPLKRKERVTDCYRKNEAVSRSDTAFCARGGE